MSRSLPCLPLSTFLSFGVISTGWDFQNTAPEYLSWSGTSFAAPHVTGVAALLLAHNPGLTRDEPRSWLTTCSGRNWEPQPARDLSGRRIRLCTGGRSCKLLPGERALTRPRAPAALVMGRPVRHRPHPGPLLALVRPSELAARSDVQVVASQAAGPARVEVESRTVEGQRGARVERRAVETGAQVARHRPGI